MNKRVWELEARRVMRGVKTALQAKHCEVSPVRYNRGGIAVMGEVTMHARIVGETGNVIGLYVQANHSLLDGTAQIMFRFEQWPEYLGGERGHKRMGPNRYTGFYNPDVDAMVKAMVTDFPQSY